MKLDNFKDLGKYLCVGQQIQEDDYVSVNLRRLAKMIEDCNQEELKTIEVDKPYFTDKVIKVKRYSTNFLLDLNHVDRVVIGGMFVQVPMYIIPKKLVEQATYAYRVKDPEKYGLPTFDEVDYNTLRELPGREYYTALAKFEGNYLNELIDTPSGYECFYI